MSIAAVGFDLDGTLAVPDRDRATLLAEASAAVGAPALSREAYLDAHRANLTGETRAPIFEALLEGDTSPEELARTYREAVNEALEPLPGIEALLADLRRRYRVGLLTNGPTVAQREKLATLGWEAAFDAVVVTGELASGKPDGAAFEALLSALGADPGETAYVGDDVEADVRGSARAGLRAVQVCYPGGPAADPAAAATVDRASLVEALPEVLSGL